MNSIPVIDLEAFLVDTPDGKEKVVSDISLACKDIGFFYVENHGLSQNLIERLEEQMHAFFNLPIADKLDIHIAKSPNHRGYFPIGEEIDRGTSLRDIKEGFDMALDLSHNTSGATTGKLFYGPNVWPAQLTDFQPTVDEYYKALRKLAEILCRAFGLALELPENFFQDKIDKPLAQLRLLHYPSQESYVLGEAIGAGPHTDYGIVTILWQDKVGGLEVQLKNKEWIKVPPLDGKFICNIGNMMARWTNDFWVATPHRVINTSGKERYSVAMFFDPNYDCEIHPLTKFVSTENPAKYTRVTMGQYLTTGFNETFAYRQGEALQ